MIRVLDLSVPRLAHRALEIQHLAYRIEADLIGFDGIPQLQESIKDLQDSEEPFIGYFVDDMLAGVLSYEIVDKTLDICRLVVHPDYFRRGIGRSLVEHVLALGNINHWIVWTGAKNPPARKLYESLGFQLVREVNPVANLILAEYEKIRVP